MGLLRTLTGLYLGQQAAGIEKEKLGLEKEKHDAAMTEVKRKNDLRETQKAEMQKAVQIGRQPKRGAVLDEGLVARTTGLEGDAAKQLAADLQNVDPSQVGTIMKAYGKKNYVPPVQDATALKSAVSPTTAPMVDPAAPAKGAAALAQPTTAPADPNKPLTPGSVQMGGIADPNNPDAATTVTNQPISPDVPPNYTGDPKKQPTVSELKNDPSLVGAKGRADDMADTDTTDPVGDLPMGAKPQDAAEDAADASGKPKGAAALAQDNGLEGQKTEIPVGAVAKDPSKMDAQGTPQPGAAPADFMSPDELSKAFGYRGADGKMYLTTEAMKPLSPGELLREQGIRLQQLGDPESVDLGMKLIDSSYKQVKQEYEGQLDDIAGRVATGQTTYEDAIKELGGAYNNSAVLPGKAEFGLNPQTGVYEMVITTPDGRKGSSPGQQFKDPREAFDGMMMQARAAMSPELYLAMAKHQLEGRKVDVSERQGDRKLDQGERALDQDDTRISNQAEQFTEGQNRDDARLGARLASDEKLTNIREGGEDRRLGARLKHDASEGSANRAHQKGMNDADNATATANSKRSASATRASQAKIHYEKGPDGSTSVYIDGKPAGQYFQGKALPQGMTQEMVTEEMAAAEKDNLTPVLKDGKLEFITPDKKMAFTSRQQALNYQRDIDDKQGAKDREPYVKPFVEFFGKAADKAGELSNKAVNKGAELLKGAQEKGKEISRKSLPSATREPSKK